MWHGVGMSLFGHGGANIGTNVYSGWVHQTAQIKCTRVGLPGVQKLRDPVGMHCMPWEPSKSIWKNGTNSDICNFIVHQRFLYKEHVGSTTHFPPPCSPSAWSEADICDFVLSGCREADEVHVASLDPSLVSAHLFLLLWLDLWLRLGCSVRRWLSTII